MIRLEGRMVVQDVGFLVLRKDKQYEGSKSWRWCDRFIDLACPVISGHIRYLPDPPDKRAKNDGRWEYNYTGFPSLNQELSCTARS